MEVIAPLMNLPAMEEDELSTLYAGDEEEGSETEDYSEGCKDHEEEEDDDPSFDPLEETRSSFSNMSLKKIRRRLPTKEDIQSGDDAEDAAKFDPKDEKNYEQVEKMIKDGQLEKLKVDQCKLYLRKHGLRLTGKKDVLVARVREHLEIVDGQGEKKYPASSFIVNCQGDACMGDVVKFEQNVYEMFSIASRSATGPPSGTRTVAGRIVKESYGAAKQQHTFTIEVLWSKGEKPLPPLHPLLIKGRNLYRLETLRQIWPDEEERKRVLQEKHMRGSVARFSREVRIKKKESRKLSCMRRGGNNEKNTANYNVKSNQAAVRISQGMNTLLSSRNKDTLVENPQSDVGNHRNTIGQASTSQNNSQQSSKVSIQPRQQNSVRNSCDRHPLKDFNYIQKLDASALQPHYGGGHQLYNSNKQAGILALPQHFSIKQPCGGLNSHENRPNSRPSGTSYVKQQPKTGILGSPPRHGLNNNKQPIGNLTFPPHSPRYSCNNYRQPIDFVNSYNKPLMGCNDPRQTTGNVNSQLYSSRNGNGNTSLLQGHSTQRQYCHYYQMARCYYMDNCKFLHQQE